MMTEKTYLTNQQYIDLIEQVELRMEECRAIIGNSKHQLNQYGQPISKGSAQQLRTSNTKELCILGLVRDLLKTIQGGLQDIGISPLGVRGLDKLLFIVRRFEPL